MPLDVNPAFQTTVPGQQSESGSEARRQLEALYDSGGGRSHKRRSALAPVLFLVLAAAVIGIFLIIQYGSLFQFSR